MRCLTRPSSCPRVPPKSGFGLPFRDGSSSWFTMMMFIVAACFHVFILMFATLSSAQMIPQPTNGVHNNQDNIYHNNNLGPTFSCGKLYYRTLHIDHQRNVLYVGAMDNLFRLNLANINASNCFEDGIRLAPTDTQKCLSKGKSESFDCKNHIKVIQPMNKLGDKLYICGTNAYNPRDALLFANNMTISSDPVNGIGGSAPAECPFNPDDNSTAIWIDRGNPSDVPGLYTGTTTDFEKADALIFRSELYNQTNGQKLHEAKRTAKYDSRSLDKPNFVGSFEIGDYVYFFFRENAVEFINCGKSIYSRVARVCKRDNGYKPVMYEKHWTTFLKARLNCSIPGEFPFYFDEIQSVHRNPYDDKKFHASFTTNSNGLTGSAICTFSLDAIQEAFNGKFKEQVSSKDAWLPVPSYKLNQNEPRPGTCVDDTKSLSNDVVNFIRSHPLMDSAVANDNGRPVFFRRDVMFTKVVVDVLEIDGITYTVYFAGTNTGHIHKIVEWYPQPFGSSSSLGGDMNMPQQDSSSSQLSSNFNFNAQSGAQSVLVEVIEATVPEPIRALEISSRHKSLYVASDTQIKQINLLNCKNRHESCLQCVRDPYCGWDRKHLECRHFSPLDTNNLIQDVTNESPEICHSLLKHKDVHVTWGQSLHLPCNFNGFIQESQDLQQLISAQQRHQVRQFGPPIETPSISGHNGLGVSQSHGILQPASYVQWYYHRRENLLTPGFPVLQRSDKFILAADQGLVIIAATEPGWYQCRLGTQVLYSYNLIIDSKSCAAPSEQEFQRVYADWCREMERYKSQYKNWHAKQNRCQAMSGNQMQHPHQQQQQQQLIGH